MKELSYNKNIYKFAWIATICAVIIVVGYFFVSADGNINIEISGSSRYSGNNSTFTASGATINGNHNTITGDNNTIRGNHNTVWGENNRLTGNNNRFLAYAGNRATGNHNRYIDTGLETESPDAAED